jgi:hypothetical protein
LAQLALLSSPQQAASLGRQLDLSPVDWHIQVMQIGDWILLIVTLGAIAFFVHWKRKQRRNRKPLTHRPHSRVSTHDKATHVSESGRGFGSY